MIESANERKGGPLRLRAPRHRVERRAIGWWILQGLVAFAVVGAVPHRVG